MSLRRLAVEGADPDDRELMRRIQAGDDEAFRRFVERHQRRFYRTAWNLLRQREEALDAVQETFLKIHAVRATWRPDGAPVTWAYRILTNECLDRRRRARVRRAQSLDEAQEAGLPDPADTRESPFEATARAERRRRVLEAIGRLPGRQRSVLLLRHVSDLPLEQIAIALGCSLGTVKSCLHRGTKKLLAEPSIAGRITLVSQDTSS
jgi:RNA polymerase sigma-70 factor (ECF subfamily)